MIFSASSRILHQSDLRFREDLVIVRHADIGRYEEWRGCETPCIHVYITEYASVDDDVISFHLLTRLSALLWRIIHGVYYEFPGEKMF